MGSFLEEYVLEISSASLFIIGFGIYSYFKLRGKSDEEKLVYYSVRDLVRQQKREQKLFNDSIGGSNKNEKFFK